MLIDTVALTVDIDVQCALVCSIFMSMENALYNIFN